MVSDTCDVFRTFCGGSSGRVGSETSRQWNGGITSISTKVSICPSHAGDLLTFSCAGFATLVSIESDSCSGRVYLRQPLRWERKSFLVRLSVVHRSSTR